MFTSKLIIVCQICQILHSFIGDSVENSNPAVPVPAPIALELKHLGLVGFVSQGEPGTVVMSLS